MKHKVDKMFLPNRSQLIRAVLILFFIGSTIGTWFDSFHSHSGTLYYPNPVFYQEAWWVPLLFGAAAVAGGLGVAHFERKIGRSFSFPSWFVVIIGLFLFGVQYYWSGYWNPGASIKILAQAVMAFIIWFLFNRSRTGLLLGVIMAIIGCLIEITLSYGGAFYYIKPDIWGIPYWLPFLYVTFSVVIGNLGKKLFA